MGFKTHQDRNLFEKRHKSKFPNLNFQLQYISFLICYHNQKKNAGHLEKGVYSQDLLSQKCQGLLHRIEYQKFYTKLKYQTNRSLSYLHLPCIFFRKLSTQTSQFCECSATIQVLSHWVSGPISMEIANMDMSRFSSFDPFHSVILSTDIGREEIS